MRDHLKDQDVGLIADRLDSEIMRGFCDRQIDRLTDICNSRVAFATEKSKLNKKPNSFWDKPVVGFWPCFNIIKPGEIEIESFKE